MTREMSKLERSILECRRRDAAALKAGLAALWHAMTAAHDPQADRLERATLRCQSRDAAAIRRGLVSMFRRGDRRDGRFGGAARA